VLLVEVMLIVEGQMLDEENSNFYYYCEMIQEAVKGN
jgi:hypothetical protein